MESERTAIHIYPAEEVAAMRAFYGGETCVVSRINIARWAHMLDAALSSSTPHRLQWMLQRHLRQDRHPAHAAEVRENVVPLDPREHSCIDLRRPRATLFLHEDLVARTLRFERDLKEWRLAEIQAGRGDPGRPEYGNVFLTAVGMSPPTPHRWHASAYYPAAIRMIPTGGAIVFSREQCPGIDPPHPNPFPVIDTLLSIPFSLLHTLPRLVGLMNGSRYRLDLVGMAMEVVSLWAWDPEVSQNSPVNTDMQRSPRPPPIYHPSRHGATFANMRPRSSSTPTIPTALTAPSGSGSRSACCVTQAYSGEYVIGIPCVRLHDGALTIFPPDPDVNMENSKTWATYVAAPLSGSYLSECIEMTHSNPGGNFGDKLDSELDMISGQARVKAWLGDVDKETLDPLPIDANDTDPFAPGFMGSMTANDILMVKGLINPLVCVQFFDLSLYH